MENKIKELKHLIDIHLAECDHTYTPTICLMKDTPEGLASLKDVILERCLEKVISVGQAVNEIEKEFNPNLNND